MNAICFNFIIILFTIDWGRSSKVENSENWLVAKVATYDSATFKVKDLFSTRGALCNSTTAALWCLIHSYQRNTPNNTCSVLVLWGYINVYVLTCKRGMRNRSESALDVHLQPHHSRMYGHMCAHCILGTSVMIFTISRLWISHADFSCVTDVHFQLVNAAWATHCRAESYRVFV